MAGLSGLSYDDLQKILLGQNQALRFVGRVAQGATTDQIPLQGARLSLNDLAGCLALFQTGPNAGAIRMVRSNDATNLYLDVSLPYPPASGDVVIVYMPGIQVVVLGTIDDQGKVSWAISKQDQGILTSNLHYYYAEDFAELVEVKEYWELVQLGAGMRVAVGGDDWTTQTPTGDPNDIMSYLTIHSGTTPGSETIIRSKFTIKPPVVLGWIGRVSQAVANQECVVEMIDTAHMPPDEWTRWKFTGVDSGAYTIEWGNENQGSSSVVSGLGNGYVTADRMYEVELDVYHLNAYDRTPNQNEIRTSRVTVHSFLPSAHEEYYIQIRLKNLPGYAGGETYFHIHRVFLLDYTRQMTEIIGGRGNSNANQALSAYIIGAQRLSVVPMVQDASGAYVERGKVTQSRILDVAPLGAGATSPAIGAAYITLDRASEVANVTGEFTFGATITADPEVLVYAAYRDTVTQQLVWDSDPFFSFAVPAVPNTTQRATRRVPCSGVAALAIQVRNNDQSNAISSAGVIIREVS